MDAFDIIYRNILLYILTLVLSQELDPKRIGTYPFRTMCSANSAVLVVVELRDAKRMALHRQLALKH